MKLSRILSHIDFNAVFNFKEKEIKDLTAHTSDFNKGDLFFFIEGNDFDIYKEIPAIISRAAAIVVNYKKARDILENNLSLPVIFVEDTKKTLHNLSEIFYPIEKKGLKVIGVTGTNGKTTVAYLIYKLLRKFKTEASLIGTIKYLIGEKELSAINTTPDSFILRKLFYRSQKKGVRHIVMEVSSHALKQKRIAEIKFTHLVFTNLTPEHLDYHKTMRDYFYAKLSLFLLNPQAQWFINSDDSYGRKILKLPAPYKYSYSLKKGSFCAEKIAFYPTHSEFNFVFPSGKVKIKTTFLGKYNVYNILGALAVIYKLGFNLQKAAGFLRKFKPPEGRMQKIAKNIFIDYAHTPDALNNALSSLRECGFKRIFLVFGCGGERDKSKRKKMGRIASLGADFSFITSDNPRAEDPLAISRQIEEGFGSHCNYRVILSRRKAIKQALAKQEKYPQAALLIAGKGHENYQLKGGRKIPFNDAEVVKEILASEAKKKKIK